MMKDNDFRFGDDVSIVITGKVCEVPCNGYVNVDNMLCDNEFVFHGHIDGEKHEIKPVRKIRRWVNLYMEKGEIHGGVKHRCKQECIDCVCSNPLAIAVEIDVDE